MNIKQKIMNKILLVPGASPEVKEELAALAQDAVDNDDVFLLLGPLYVFHEGHGEDNQEYVTEEATYHLVKKFGILSMVCRILEFKENREEIVRKLTDMAASAREGVNDAVFCRAMHALNEWDLAILDGGVMSWCDDQGVTHAYTPEAAKETLDRLGVTAFVRRIIGE